MICLMVFLFFFFKRQTIADKERALRSRQQLVVIAEHFKYERINPEEKNVRLEAKEQEQRKMLD